MKVTIATHNGHVVAYRHNIRDKSVTDKEKHIDPNGWHFSAGVTEREAYEKIFGQAVNEYNEKQKRQERKIESYYDTVKRDSRKHTAYELIVGVYPAKGEQLSDEEQKQILSEYIKDFQKNNPNMKVFAYHFHFDEESPHLHLDYIPVGHGFKRGMRTQSSLTKALEGQGFITQGKETAQIQWERSENERLERICKAHGLEVEHPQRGQNVQHKETEVYKLDKEIEQKEGRIEQLTAKEKEITEIAEKKLGALQQIDRLEAMEAFIEKAQVQMPDGSIKSVREGFERYIAQLERYYPSLDEDEVEIGREW